MVSVQSELMAAMGLEQDCGYLLLCKAPALGENVLDTYIYIDFLAPLKSPQNQAVFSWGQQ